MRDVEIKNAVITNAELTIEDHGLLTAWLTLDYGGAGQGFGGYGLYLPKGFKFHALASPAGHWIFRVLEVAGVEKWSRLVGKTVRVRCEHTKVHAIGHIVKDDWFEPSADFKSFDEKAGEEREP